jgi:hypothetical protein
VGAITLRFHSPFDKGASAVWGFCRSPQPGVRFGASHPGAREARQADGPAQLNEPARSASGRSLEAEDPHAPIGEVAVAIKVAEQIEDVNRAGGDGRSRADRRG